jgi:hypothetical protein
MNGIKKQKESCSRFATNLGNQEWMRSSEREEKGALKTANLGERDQNHSCPRPGPTRLHTLRPHTLRPQLRSYEKALWKGATAPAPLVWKGALKRRSEKALWKLSSHIQPNAVSSCPTWSLSTSPTRRGPTWRGPTRQHENGQLNGNPPARAPSEGFRQGLGENWGKTKRLGKTEYN